MQKKIVLGLFLLVSGVGALKADSFEEWSRQRREQWADDAAAWQDTWDRQALENRLEQIEAELNGDGG